MAFQQFSLLARNSVLSAFSRQISTSHGTKFIQFTPYLCAEPLKKKKRVDPAVVKAREDRRKRKMEKQIRRLEKNERQLKPIDEVEVPLDLIDEKKRRTRNVVISPQRLEEFALLKKEWSRYMLQQHLADTQMIDRINVSQQRALEHLRLESEELYQEAVKIDLSLLPFTFNGPVDTPPITNYNSPDGEYLDIKDVDGNLSAENSDDDGNESGGKPGQPLREQDRFLPIANVAKIMKKAVPEMGKIAKEARECVQECVSEFISFITSEASDRCHMEKRKTINGEDILFAMVALGFDNYVEPLKLYLQKYRETTKLDKVAVDDVFAVFGD